MKLLNITLSCIVLTLSQFGFSQVACTGGPITVTEGNCITVGDGTPGYVQLDFTNITIYTQNGGNYDYAYVISSASGYIDVGSTGSFMQTSDNCSSCTGMTTNLSDPQYLSDGYITICVVNGGSGASSVTFNWTTVDGSGTDQCVETCFDGIQNQDETGVDCGGTFCIPCSCTNGIQDAGETGVDCGGPCGPCGDCYDGIQNGSETGVDCGAPGCLPCSTNSSLGSSTQCCTGTAQASVYPTNCDQVGTSAYNLNSPVIETTSQSAGGCLPSPSPSGCGTVTGTGSWTHLTLEDGVTQIQSSWAQGGNDGVGAGSSTTYSALYQGSSCASLSYVNCQPIVDFASGSYYVYQAVWTGLDPNQDVWIYTWNDNNKGFNLDFQYIGVATPPTNTACPGSTALGDACNLGATGASFNTPGSQGVLCNGGNWGSNENTTFYSFTADALTGSLEIQNITCNDGTNGDAQFAVWTSCAAIGTYGSSFLGCAVGTGTISLSPLVPGQTYYIAADGFAGDNCAWEFTGTGIILPIELGSFTATHTGTEVNLEWMTVTEENNSHFIIQRTLDGVDYEDIGMVEGAGTSNDPIDYTYVDRRPYMGTSYYRLKQVDYDGKFGYSEVVAVNGGKVGATIIRTVNLMGQDVDHSYKGIVIDLYSDGTSEKRIQ